LDGQLPRAGRQVRAPSRPLPRLLHPCRHPPLPQAPGI
ncbi:MAG: hypothetical protein AVDCRST_MAG93-1438, partial [uncultured Chloroflexia bacterium]